MDVELTRKAIEDGRKLVSMQILLFFYLLTI